MKTIKLQSPLDMHLHLRDAEMLGNVAPISARDFAGAVIMPNLIPPVLSKKDVIAYRERINEAIRDEQFTPYMTLFFQDSFTREMLEDAQSEILSIKMYPDGVTTNSDGGAKEIISEKNFKVFKAMEDLGIPLNVHGETCGFVMDRERDFVPFYRELAEAFPKLKIIMEHITTKDTADLLDQYDNLHATITLHHLLITLDDVAGGMLKPHLFCKPIAKRYEDRDALVELALNAHQKVMFGSDSAPHPQHKKECPGCAAGVFSAPVILPRLVELFEENGRLDNLQKFISDNVRDIYGITPVEKEIILEQQEWIVPEKYGEVVPFLAGEKLKWRVRR